MREYAPAVRGVANAPAAQKAVTSLFLDANRNPNEYRSTGKEFSQNDVCLQNRARYPSHERHAW